MKNFLTGRFSRPQSLMIIILVMAIAAPMWLRGADQNPPAGSNMPVPGVSTNPPQTINTQTFSNLARKVIPSVVTVYVKRDLTRRLTPEQRQELERLRRFFSDPQLRQFLPPGMQSPDDENGGGGGGDEGSQGGGEGGDENAIITQGSGSGVIVSADGYIVTNWHVVGDKKDQPEIRVVLPDDTELTGKDVELIDSSRLADLALLKVKRTDLTPIKFGDSDKVQIGDWVAAVGSPLELKQTITQGIISAKHREFGSSLGDMLQTDAAINPGSSGGALVNLTGELVGINRMIATLTQGWAGYGFAIPSNQVKYFVDQVISKGSVSFGYIGIFMAGEDQDSAKLRQALGLSKDLKGVLVQGTNPGSPAEKAGLQEGDFITAVDGHEVHTTGDLLNYVARRPVGSTIKVDYLRPGDGGQAKKMTASLRIAQRPGEEELMSGGGQKGGGQRPKGRRQRGGQEDMSGKMGVQVEPYTGAEGKGLKVTEVQPGSPAAKAGVQQGDILLKLNRMPLATPQDLSKAYQARKEGESQLLYIMRNGQKFLVAVE